MTFNFEHFKQVAKIAYRRCGDHPYTLEDVLDIFEYYFDSYELVFERPHPMISLAQTERIIRAMPECDNPGLPWDTSETIEPGDYEELIDQHFSTEYRSCDYNVNHFFCGAIRYILARNCF